MKMESRYLCWLEDLTSGDVKLVGGKNASLGEMIRSLKEEGVRVPDGFATTAEAYWRFLEANELKEKIHGHLEDLRNEQKDRSMRSERRYASFLKGRNFPKRSPPPSGNPTEISAGAMIRKMSMWPQEAAQRRKTFPKRALRASRRRFSMFPERRISLDACRKCYASLLRTGPSAIVKRKGSST
jgi:pyruvate, water dikinase